MDTQVAHVGHLLACQAFLRFFLSAVNRRYLCYELWSTLRNFWPTKPRTDFTPKANLFCPQQNTSSELRGYIWTIVII